MFFLRPKKLHCSTSRCMISWVLVDPNFTSKSWSFNIILNHLISPRKEHFVVKKMRTKYFSTKKNLKIKRVREFHKKCRLNRFLLVWTLNPLIFTWTRRHGGIHRSPHRHTVKFCHVASPRGDWFRKVVAAKQGGCNFFSVLVCSFHRFTRGRWEPVFFLIIFLIGTSFNDRLMPKPFLVTGLPDFTSSKIPKQGKIYQNTTKNTKWP
jgi:hypothetical protein